VREANNQRRHHRDNLRWLETDRGMGWGRELERAQRLRGGSDEILYRYRAADGKRLRYHHDVHGNVTSVLDFWSGGLLEKYAYDAFGKPTILSANNSQLSTSAVGNRFLFQGREWLGELGIYDYRHRMYHPGLGRFLQTDPLGLGAGDMNLFRFCGDDPVDRNDPTGLYYTKQELDATHYVVEVPIRYEGPGNTKEARESFKRGIEGLSGKYHKEVNGKNVEYDVRFKVTQPKHFWEKANTVAIEKGAGKNGFGFEKGTDSATWFAKGGRLFDVTISPEEGARHSVGHFLGLREGYNQQTGKTKVGFEGHLMDFHPGGTIPDRDMNRILNRSWFEQNVLLRNGAQVEHETP